MHAKLSDEPPEHLSRLLQSCLPDASVGGFAQRGPEFPTVPHPCAVPTAAVSLIDELILNSISQGVQWIDCDGLIVYENPAAARLLGWEPQEMIGRHGHALMHHSRADGTAYPGHACPVYQALQDGQTRRVDNEVFWRKDGTFFFVEYTATPVQDAQGKVSGLVILFIDITERKRTEEALAREREFLGALLESLSDGIAACNEAGELRVFNHATRTFTDLPEDPLTPEQWAERFGLYHSDAQTRMQAQEVPLFRALQGETVRDVPMVILHEGEPERHLLASGQAIRDAQGRRLGAVVAMRDVTASREAEAARHESEQHLRLALEGSGLGSYLLDLKTAKFLVLSETCRAHLAVGPGAQVTRTEFLAKLHPDDRERVQQEFAGAVQQRRGYEAEYRVLWPDGSQHWISARGCLVYDKAGMPLRIVGVTQEITERKQQEQEAKADCDPVTGLWNHRAFHRRLKEETARAQREGTTLAVAMLDLDGFQLFNNNYGHSPGDEVLRQAAARIGQVCRPYDTIARFGGDEFALLLPNVGSVSAVEIEARLRRELAGLTCCPTGEETLPISLSVGVALFTETSLDHREVLRQAEERLLWARTGGAETQADQVRGHMAHIAGFTMLDALVTAVDNKDRYTRRHSEDVLNYSLMIAQQLGLESAV